MSRNNSSGFRLDLGVELESKLADFCAAYYNASKTQVIREALNSYIDAVLDNEPERRKRYELEKRKRLGQSARVKIVRSDVE